MHSIAAEGYPRADVDLFLVRTTRQQIIRLQNDLKAKMRELDDALVRVHSFGPGVLGPGRSSKPAPPAPSPSALPPPFAEIDAVTPGSPAAAAGLLVGDRIAIFGSLGAGDGARAGESPAPPLLPTLAQLGQVTRESEGRALRVVVVRRAAAAGGAAGGDAAAGAAGAVELTLTPQRWAGPGLLGCHVVPVTTG